jgi:hypothetical protein
MPTDDLRSDLFTVTLTPEYGIKSVHLTGTIGVDSSSLITTSTETDSVYYDKWDTTTGEPYTISSPNWYVSGWTCGTPEEEPEESRELVLKTRKKRIKLNFNL